MANRRRTLCTSRSGNEVLAEKTAIVPFAEIFRPADDETVPLYFVYSKPARRRQGGKDTPPFGWIFRQDEAQRRRRTLCTSRSGNEVLAEKNSPFFGWIFRQDEAQRRRRTLCTSRSGTEVLAEKTPKRKGERWAAALFILTSVIRDVGSVDGLQASRLPSAGGRWKQ